jgi:hypothetical protein
MSKKKLNPRRKPMTVVEAKEDAYKKAIYTVLGILFYTLLDKHNAPKDEIKQLYDEMNDVSDMISKGYLNMRDIFNTLKKEYDIELGD